MNNICIFCKIRDSEVATEFTYEDRDTMVFPDINPVRPVHLLIVPKIHIKDFTQLTDNLLWTKLLNITKEMIKEQKLEDRGYKILINGGGAQVIDHLHIHLMGPLGKKVPL